MSARKNPETERFKGPAKWVQYLLARSLVVLFQCLPIGIAFKLGRGVGWLCWRLMKRRRAVVHKNLEIVNAWLLEKTEGGDLNPDGSVEFTNAGQESQASNLEEQVREVFQRSGANLIAGFPLSRLGAKGMAECLEIEGVEHLHTALAKGKGAIMLLAHMGPWEALAHLPQLAADNGISANLGAMYRPLNNFYLDRWIREQREAKGTRLFSRREGFHKPVDFLRSGGVLGILADQKMREGPTAPYFGRDVPSSPIPGLFHRRSGAPILALSIVTISPCRWRLRVLPVEIPLETEVSDRTAMAAICNRATSESLCQSPLDGFWLHKRF